MRILIIYKNKLKLIVLSSLGGAIELYDFILFAIFATAIGDAFLPAEEKTVRLMAVFAAFAVGYIARPLGGIIFSHFGDKYTRKKAFLFSISIIGFATLAIGLLPSYKTIGIWAPIILLLLRFIQGLAIGGEMPGAITFIAEHIPSHTGFACGCLYFFANLGILTAIITKMLLLTFDQSYAWRFAFILGGLLAIVSYFLRKKIAESKIFSQEKHRHKIPFFALCKCHPRNILLAIFISGGHATSISLLFLYVVPHMELLGFDAAYVNGLNMLATLIMAIFCLLGGILSDFVRKKHMICLSFLSLIPLGWLFFSSIANNSFIMPVYVLVSMAAGCVIGPMGGYLAKLFTTDVRYSGIALCYNLGFAIFGGFSIFLTSWYLKVTGDNMAPFYSLTIILIAASIAILCSNDSASEL